MHGNMVFKHTMTLCLDSSQSITKRTIDLQTSKQGMSTFILMGKAVC